MPPPDEGIGVGELSRQVRDALIRFEGLTKRLEDAFIRKEVFDLYKEGIKQTDKALDDRLVDLDKNKAGTSELKALTDRVAQLEDDKKWLVRLVLAFIVLGVLAALVTFGGGGTGSTP